MYQLGQKIFLVPDSGYQMFFFPLAIEGDDDSESTLKSMATGKADLHAIIMANQAKVGWAKNPKPTDIRDIIQSYDQSGWKCCTQGHRFVRHRLGPCDALGKRFLGIWMAIETNLGERDRGWFYEEIKSADPKVFTSDVLGRTPYAASSLHKLPANREDSVAFEYNGTKFDQPIQWKVPVADDIEVDLIIDFGNSRTCAMVLERRVERDAAMHGDKFAELCRPLPLRPSFFSDVKDVSVDDAIVSSRFVLKTPEFRAMDYDAGDATTNPLSLVSYAAHEREETSGFLIWKKTQNVLDHVSVMIPHMFAKLSPVCLGDDMSDMVRGTSFAGLQFKERIRHGQNLQQSSAKRFFWDDRPLDANEHGPWSMMPNYGDIAYGKGKNLSNATMPQLFEPIPLAGLFLRFQPQSGQVWARGDAPIIWGKLPAADGRLRSAPTTKPSRPLYPRRNALTWSILSILETAQRHINSANWVAGTQAGRRRRIRTVVGTYPSGWSGSELQAYRAKWQEALDIFSLTHFAKGVPPVSLEMDLDESVASQLPLLYSCITNFANGNKGENWIQLNGVERPGKMPMVRVMNIDIGGGTTDVSVVEYVDAERGINVDLNATVRFRDSYSDAGDGLLKMLIEEVLLDKLSGTGAGRSASIALFREVFAGEQVEKPGPGGKAVTQHKEQEISSQRVGWLISVLSPMAIRLLQCRAEGKPLKISPEDAGVQQANWNDFKQHFGVTLGYASQVQFEADVLDALAVKQFGLLIESLAKFVMAFDVHMLFVCGKPSEQPAIRQLVERLLPLPLERIHFASGFRSGQWYPFRRRSKLDDDAAGADANERIDDAKTVTCVGAALARAIHARLIPGWKIKISKQEGLLNTWGEMISEPRNRPRSFQKTMVFTGGSDLSDPIELSLEHNRWVGRKMFDFDDQRPEPVYKLIWKGDVRGRPDSVRVVFKRIPSSAESADALEVVKVTDQEGKTDLADKVTLQLYPVSTAPWLDSGKLFDK